jgi:hypothetical protein
MITPAELANFAKQWNTWERAARMVLDANPRTFEEFAALMRAWHGR